MENLKCPNCGLINVPDTKQCACGFTFVADLNKLDSSQNKDLEKKQSKINFFKKNQVGIIVFCALLGLRFLWIGQKADKGLSDYFAALLTILFDSPIILILAVLAQWITNMFKKNEKNEI